MQQNSLTVSTSSNNFNHLVQTQQNLFKIPKPKKGKQGKICHYTRHLESANRELSNVRRPIEQVPQTQTKAELAILYRWDYIEDWSRWLAAARHSRSATGVYAILDVDGNMRRNSFLIGMCTYIAFRWLWKFDRFHDSKSLFVQNCNNWNVR